jgi:hypothetical protein
LLIEASVFLETVHSPALTLVNSCISVWYM